MADRETTPIGTLPVGTRVRLRSIAVITAAGTPTVVQTDQGSAQLDPAIEVAIIEAQLPTTVGSVILASVNGGRDEALTLALNNNAVARWFQPSTRTFLGNQDQIVAKAVLYLAPLVAVAAPVVTTVAPAPTK